VAAKAVTGEVKASTGGAQIPYLYSSLTRDFELSGPGAAARARGVEGGSSLPPAEGRAPAVQASSGPRVVVTRAYGSLVVSAAAAGSLFIDGNPMGELPANAEARIDNVDVGAHAVEIRYSASAVERKDAVVEKGKAIAVAFAYKAFTSSDGKTVFSALGDTRDNPRPLARRTIAMSGEVRDWEGIDPIWVAPPGAKPILDQDGSIFQRLYLCRDDKYLYWAFEFASLNPLVKIPAKTPRKIALQLSIEFKEKTSLQLELLFDREQNAYSSPCGVWDDAKKLWTDVGVNIIRSKNSTIMSEARIGLGSVEKYARGTLPIYVTIAKIDRTGNWQDLERTPYRYADFR
jgi:hypothetical protein